MALWMDGVFAKISDMFPAPWSQQINGRDLVIWRDGASAIWGDGIQQESAGPRVETQESLARFILDGQTAPLVARIGRDELLRGIRAVLEVKSQCVACLGTRTAQCTNCKGRGASHECERCDHKCLDCGGSGKRECGLCGAPVGVGKHAVDARRLLRIVSRLDGDVVEVREINGQINILGMTRGAIIMPVRLGEGVKAPVVVAQAAGVAA